MSSAFISNYELGSDTVTAYLTDENASAPSRLVVRFEGPGAHELSQSTGALLHQEFSRHMHTLDPKARVSSSLTGMSDAIPDRQFMEYSFAVHPGEVAQMTQPGVITINENVISSAAPLVNVTNRVIAELAEKTEETKSVAAAIELYKKEHNIQPEVVTAQGTCEMSCAAQAQDPTATLEALQQMLASMHGKSVG